MPLSVANRGYVLETNRLPVQGKPEEPRNGHQVRAAHLGGSAAH